MKRYTVLSTVYLQFKTNYVSTQRVRSPPQASGFLSSVQWVFLNDVTWDVYLSANLINVKFDYFNTLRPLLPSAGEDAARCSMSSFNLCPSSVFRRSLLPADEWEEAHMDLPCMRQACSLWAAHYWWVRRQKHALTCSTVVGCDCGTWIPTVVCSTYISLIT